MIVAVDQKIPAIFFGTTFSSYYLVSYITVNFKEKFNIWRERGENASNMLLLQEEAVLMVSVCTNGSRVPASFFRRTFSSYHLVGYITRNLKERSNFLEGTC